MAFIKLNYKSKELGREISAQVFLPADLLGKEAEPPYRTCYFLPGYSAGGTELYTYLGFRMQCDLKGIAVVIPEGENSFYIDHPERGMNYSSYVGAELVEMTRKLLPLSDKREDTYIGGISMGGFGALYNGLRYRDTFSKIAVMSPVVDCLELTSKDTCADAGFPEGLFHYLFGEEKEYLKSDANLKKFYLEADKDKIPETFLCCGRQDRLVYRQVKAFVDVLRENGKAVSYKETDGDHELEFWGNMMDPAFSFLAGIEEGEKNRMVLK